MFLEFYMATVTRTTATPTPAASLPPEDAPAVITVNKPAPLKIKLRTKPLEPTHNFDHLRIAIVGEAGVGKTTLGLTTPGVYNLSFDPLRPSYGGIQDLVPDWRHFLGYLQLFEKKAEECREKDLPFPYKRIQIDGTEIWYRHGLKHVCLNRLGGIDHPRDEEYGKGWDILKDELATVVDRLMALPCGLWFTCHPKDKEHQRWDGSKIMRIAPELAKAADDIVCGRCDVIMNMSYIGDDNRIATIRGNEAIKAKCDINGRFLTPDGRQIKEIVLGNKGPDQAFGKLMRAYNNQQTWVNFAEMMAIAERQKAAKAAKEAATTAAT